MPVPEKKEQTLQRLFLLIFILILTFPANPRRAVYCSVEFMAS